MPTFDLDEGLALKHKCVESAARWRKECLAACRKHLIDLAILRDDGCVTADDAYECIERKGLEPLGSAAGSLSASGQRVSLRTSRKAVL